MLASVPWSGGNRRGDNRTTAAAFYKFGRAVRLICRRAMWRVRPRRAYHSSEPRNEGDPRDEDPQQQQHALEVQVEMPVLPQVLQHVRHPSVVPQIIADHLAEEGKAGGCSARGGSVGGGRRVQVEICKRSDRSSEAPWVGPPLQHRNPTEPPQYYERGRLGAVEPGAGSASAAWCPRSAARRICRCSV